MKAQSREISRLTDVIVEKDLLISSLKADLQQKQDYDQSLEEQRYTENHKLKMKIEYLTNKCFQLNCKLDKKDFTPEQIGSKQDLTMVFDIIDKKHDEYCNTESMQNNIRKLSEQNNQLKQDLIETKVKWAESEGQKERIEISLNTIKTKIQRASLTESQFSNEDTFENNEGAQNRGSSTQSFTSKYLSGFGFWGSQKE